MTTRWLCALRYSLSFLSLLLLQSATAFSSSRSSNGISTTDALSFVTNICGALKDIKRTGWVNHQIPLPESDSDHMHRCAMCALLVSQPVDPRDSYESAETEQYHPATVDATRLLKMALTHDLCESIAGDVTPFCGVTGDEKYAAENAAMNQIREVLGDPLGKELYELWMEYEQQETAEAVYCKDIDKFEMVVQAYEYEKKHLRERPTGVDPFLDLGPESEERPTVQDHPLRRFFQTTRSSMRTPLFRRLDRELREQRKDMLQLKGWDATVTEEQDYK